MKNKSVSRQKFFIILLLLTFSCSVFYAPEGFTQEKTQVVLVNPSLGDVRSFIYFVENDILTVPDIELDCVFYSRARTDLSRLDTFLKQNDYPFVHIWKFEGNLNPDDLFRKNSFSNDFYKLFQRTNGVVFFGGPDVPPEIFGQKTGLLTNITTPHRHYFELSLIFHLLGGSQDDSFKPYMEENPDYAVIGFCLGMQTINIATGGTLYQDIPADVYKLKYVEDVIALGKDRHHKNPWRELYPRSGLMGINFHRIKCNGIYPFTDDYLLSDNKNPVILSSHHQAVKDPGKGFKVAGTSMDGKVIEVIVHSEYKNVIGVQFHPESRSLYQTNGTRDSKVTPDDTEAFTNNEILRKENSLSFHKKLWKHFGKMFSEQ